MATSPYNAERPELRDDGTPAAVDWVRRTGQADTFLATLDRHLQRRTRRRWAGAASAAAVLVVAGIVWTSMTPTKPITSATPSVIALGAAAQQVLVDGSEVDLNEGADVAVAFSAESRRVALQRGMAHFRVAKSPVPFVVAAGQVEVRAVGTAFATRLSPTGEVEVIVTEGVVAIDRPAPKSARASNAAPVAIKNGVSSSGPGRTERTLALLQAGNRLIVPAGDLAANLENGVATLTEEEMARSLDWRVPQLRFDGMPLAEAVPMFNRHSKIQLRLADAAVGAVKVSGTLRADTVAPLVRMLELEHGLKAVREGDVITLSGAAESGR